MDREQQHSSVDDDWQHKLRRYLLLLASLAATVTYAAGLDPPGGSWVETDSETKAVAGDSILRTTNHRRYLAFYYSNATAFAASLVVILLLLVLADKNKPLGRHTIHLPFLRQNLELDLQTTHLRVLRLVMVLDLLALMVAYTAGSCRDKVTRFYTGALVLALSAYVGYHFLEALRDNFNNRARARRRPAAAGAPRLSVESPPPTSAPPAAVAELEQLRKMLMLLSIFAATITYDAGLKPPGGFWEHTNGGLNRPGEVVLNYRHGGRFAVFFFSNTTAFIASLFTVVLLLHKKLTTLLYGFVVLTTLAALVVAYVAGSCRKAASTSYTLALAAPVLGFIFLAAAAHYIIEWLLSCMPAARGAGTIPAQPQPRQGAGQPDYSLNQRRSLVLLLATLAASITYQAGLSPPGGVWLQNQSGHKAGDPILLDTDNKRYTIFFYCNSTALVASIVVILMVQFKSLLKRKALQTAIVFDLVGLMGAYIAGSSRTLRASVHVLVLAAVFLVYVMGTYLYRDPNHQPPRINGDDAAAAGRTKKRRKRLLLCAILMAAITYQAGLRPPGGFWRVEQGQGHGHSSPGSPILQVMYPRRYQAFFYCNAMSFMASMALIILLQGDKSYQQPAAGIRFYGLYACMLVGMLALMGAYAAGTARRKRTSIYIFVLVGAVFGFIALLLVFFLRIRRQQRQQGASSSSPTTPTTPAAAGNRQPSNVNGDSTAGNHDDGNHLDRQSSSNTANGGVTAQNNNGGGDNNRRREEFEGDHAKRKYVMLLAMLAASVTYQAGLDPPGGVWADGYAAGSSVLHDSNLLRFHVFFYSNSGSFVASIVVIILLLQSELLNIKYRLGHQQLEQQRGNPLLLMATNTVVVLDLVGILVAYATGSSRTMNTSLYIIVLVVAVVIYILVHVTLPAVFVCEGRERSNTQDISSGQSLNGGNGHHTHAIP